jgi:hypothetical protein
MAATVTDIDADLVYFEKMAYSPFARFGGSSFPFSVNFPG